MNEILYIIALSLGSVVTIFILTKLMGYREISQMSTFDYINSITIGSIAAEMATSLENNFMQPLVAMIVYAMAALALSWLSLKSLRARRVIEGAPLVLLNGGELYRENLKKAKINVTEFLAQCRINGYFDISKLEAAILEGDGKISFLPKVSDRPLTPSDMQLHPQQNHLVANVILDGEIRYENLKHTGNDEKWLLGQIKARGANEVKDVLLATCDTNNQVTIFLKENRKEAADVLM